MVSALKIARDLGAQNTRGIRVVRIPLYLDGFIAFHSYQHGAGVGAIMRTGRADGTGEHDF